MRRRAALAALWGAWHAAAGAQERWQRTLRILVVYPPGGLSDAIARDLAARLAARLRVQVIVENRAGAGGSLGLESLAREPRDGQTLAFSAISPLTLKPHLEKVPYDPLRDFEPVAAVMRTPVLLVGTQAFAGNSFADLLALARAQPGALRWATSGQATAGHLVLEQVQLGANVRITHVPYKGGGQQINDALAGHFELLSTNVAAAQIVYVRAGRFKALAVGAPGRLPLLPEVPTFTELGLPGANVTSLFGLFAASGCPPELIGALNREVNAVLAEPGFAQRLRDADNLPAGGTAADFAQEIRREWQDNRALRHRFATPN